MVLSGMNPAPNPVLHLSAGNGDGRPHSQRSRRNRRHLAFTEPGPRARIGGQAQEMRLASVPLDPRFHRRRVLLERTHRFRTRLRRRAARAQYRRQRRRQTPQSGMTRLRCPPGVDFANRDSRPRSIAVPAAFIRCAGPPLCARWPWSPTAARKSPATPVCTPPPSATHTRTVRDRRDRYCSFQT